MKRLLRGVVASLMVIASITLADEPASFRIIPIPKEEFGYNTFETTIITSQGDLDTFLEKTSPSQQSPWNRRAEFEKSLAQAKLNFDRESLVLIRQTEGSGTVQVTFCQPRIKGTKLICQIDRKVPNLGTGDMAYYCFALAVAKTKVTELEIQVPGKPSVILAVPKTNTSNKSGSGNSK